MNRIKQGFTIFLGVFSGLRIDYGKNSGFKAFVATLAIMVCGLVEAGTLKPWDAITESLNSSQVFHSECVDNLCARDIGFSEVKDSIGKSGAKNIASSPISQISLYGKSSKNTYKTNQNSGQRTSIFYKYLFEHGFIGFLGWFPLLPYIFKKPNDCVEGRGGRD